jgi:uncharacterized protein YbjT (DUF2867 family)
MKIIITGSLGNISRPLASKLLNAGHAVTVISSTQERCTAIEALGATAAIGDVEDRQFLTLTFSGADAVYCMVPPNFFEADQVAYYEKIASSYADALAAAGIRRVVHLSSYGAHLAEGTGIIKGSYEAEQIFNGLSGINLTHVRPSYFFYNLLGFIPMIKSAGFIGTVYGAEDRVPMVAPEDIAALIAEEVVQMDSTNKVRYVTSDERSCNEIASVLGQAIGRPDLRWRLLPEEQVFRMLVDNGVDVRLANSLVELASATHSGILRGDFDQQPVQVGKVRLEDFTEIFNSVYQHA